MNKLCILRPEILTCKVMLKLTAPKTIIRPNYLLFGYVLVLAADTLFLVRGAWAPGASFLLVGPQVFLLTDSTAAPRLTAVAWRH